MLIGSSEVSIGSSEVLIGSSDVSIGSSEVLIGSSDVSIGSSEGLIGSSEVLIGSFDVLIGSSEMLIGSSEVLFWFWMEIMSSCQKHLPNAYVLVMTSDTGASSSVWVMLCMVMDNCFPWLDSVVVMG